METVCNRFNLNRWLCNCPTFRRSDDYDAEEEIDV
jgi:hypothetical protein